MIIGSDFGKKNQNLLREIGRLSNGDATHKIQVREINKTMELDRTEVKNLLEHLDSKGYIEIVTIGGPLLYGHVRITESGLEKYHELG